MKKFIVILLIVSLLVITLSACGNVNVGFGNYTYTHAYVCTPGNSTGFCCEISSWHNDGSGIELHTTNHGDLFCSEGTYVLFDYAASCPYCG